MSSRRPCDPDSVRAWDLYASSALSALVTREEFPGNHQHEFDSSTIRRVIKIADALLVERLLRFPKSGDP